MGAISLAGLSGVASASESQTAVPVTRLRGSYDSPLSFAETRAELEKLANRTSSADRSLFADKAVPEFSEEHRIVEYVARIDKKGRLSQYYGAAVEAKEASIHETARQKETAFEREGDSPTTSDVSIATTSGPDWNYIQDNQAHVSDHWGELNNNYEWYRIRESDQERNAFRTRAASSDDTFNPYDRNLDVTHDWSVSQLGSEAIHDADPTTSSSGGTKTVSIGFPPSAELSWTFDSDGGHTQNLTNSGPTVDWSNDIPNSGTSWFHPGSHVVADPAHCYGDQDVVKLRAEATWGRMYELWHNWNIYTTTC